MIETVIIAVRLAQYASVAVLLGSAAFYLYAPVSDLPPAFARGARTLLAVAAAVLTGASLTAIGAQSVFFAGSIEDGLTRESLVAVATQMSLGKAALVRAAAAAAAFAALLALRPSRATWTLVAALGCVAAVSLAWMGHAGAGEGAAGWVLLLSDIFHLLAAATWLGALAAFVQLLFLKPVTARLCQTYHLALHRFSTLGSVLVATLLATGAVNSWLIIGPEGLTTIWNGEYGRLLILKLMLFAVMVGFAAMNRFRLTPALARRLDHVSAAEGAVRSLRRSVVLETVAGALVLALVAWLGTLSPAPF